jgi:flagellar biosynthesis/type III secretory pathway chaperone
MIYDANGNGLPRAEDYRQGHEVVERREWEAYGIMSSADYLRQLFQENGEVIRANQTSNGDITVFDDKSMD